MIYAPVECQLSGDSVEKAGGLAASDMRLSLPIPVFTPAVAPSLRVF